MSNKQKKELEEILAQDIPQEALAEGNKTPLEEAIEFIETLLEEEYKRGLIDGLVRDLATREERILKEREQEVVDDHLDGSFVFATDDKKPHERARELREEVRQEVVGEIVTYLDFEEIKRVGVSDELVRGARYGFGLASRKIKNKYLKQKGEKE